jgi:hypothetical protein
MLIPAFPPRRGRAMFPFTHPLTHTPKYVVRATRNLDKVASPPPSAKDDAPVAPQHASTNHLDVRDST